MKQTKKLLLLITLLITLNTCKDNVIGPDDSNAVPGRRDYTWTADTIKAYYIYFSSFWGKAENDVWAVSMVGSVFENIHRYNGTNWYREIRIPLGNTASLWGTENNLWISCHDGRIWNYKNDTFSMSPQFLYEGKEIDFLSLAGKNDSEIYAGGGANIPMNKDAILYKYNVNSWQLDKTLKNNGNITRVRYSAINNRYYILTSLDNTTLNDTVRLYEYNGKDLKVIYQNYVSESTSCVMNDINGYLYVTIGHNIFRYYKDNFEKILELNNPNFGGQTWGRNKNDLFIRMFDGLMHYNGSDVQYILKFPTDMRFGTSALVLEKDIFLHAFDNTTGYNIIYHGKLKEN